MAQSGWQSLQVGASARADPSETAAEGIGRRRGIDGSRSYCVAKIAWRGEPSR